MPMTPDERKRALKAKRLTYRDIAARVKPTPVSAKTVWANVHDLPGQGSRRVKRVIARAIGRPFEDVYGAESAA